MIERDFSEYPLRLDVFEGPIDLLLHLIRKHEIDIFDIPIVRVTEQYNNYLQIMKDINLDIAGEYLSMAATLIYIKSRMLLPGKPAGDEEDDEPPREELVERLLEYRQYKAAVDILREKEVSREKLWQRPGDIVDQYIEAEPDEVEADILDLVTAFRDLLKEKNDLVSISRDDYTIEEKMRDIMSFLENRKSVKFALVFAEMNSKQEMIVTFLAMLELIKMGVIRAYQSKMLTDIRIYKRRELSEEEVPPA